MGSRDKLIVRMRSHPEKVRFEELVRLLRASGYEERQVRGSHHRFVRPAGGPAIHLVRPHGREPYCRPWEVLEVLAAIEESNDDRT
ncbi:MAG: type II toxin-antitoxin system HicA family toxin [Armatimonadetes bacterium]|nr:type II toxin-antitoxin system HicA family toxin [Armatimonadota bacterium]